MTPQRFRKRPVDIDAMQLDRDNAKDVCDWIQSRMPDASVWYNADGAVGVDTLEGLMRVDIGDWVIRGVQGEFYPCKPDIFDATYEPADTP